MLVRCGCDPYPPHKQRECKALPRTSPLHTRPAANASAPRLRASMGPAIAIRADRARAASARPAMRPPVRVRLRRREHRRRLGRRRLRRYRLGRRQHGRRQHVSWRWRTREGVEDDKGGEGSVQDGAAAHCKHVGLAATAERRGLLANRLNNAIADGLGRGGQGEISESIAELLSGRGHVWLLGWDVPRGRARHGARHCQLPSACGLSECLGQHVGEAAVEGLLTGIYFPRDAARCMLHAIEKRRVCGLGSRWWSSGAMRCRSRAVGSRGRTGGGVLINSRHNTRRRTRARKRISRS
jgi:hypothetical protein